MVTEAVLSFFRFFRGFFYVFFCGIELETSGPVDAPQVVSLQSGAKALGRESDSERGLSGTAKEETKKEEDKISPGRACCEEWSHSAIS